MPTWLPHPRLEAELAPRIKKVTDRMPPQHLQAPTRNETFEVPDQAWDRLQDWAFSQGFAIIIGQCGDRRKNYRCVHHSKGTKNWRKLPEHAGEANPENDKVRKQEKTKIKSKDCKWHYYIAWKSLKRGSDEDKTWVLGVGLQEHTHDLVPNPLFNQIHPNRNEDYAIALELSKTNRRAKLPYSLSERVLDHTPKDPDQEFTIPKKKYYDLVPSTIRSREDVLQGLLKALDSEQFTSYPRHNYVKNAAGAIQKRILQQVVIIDNNQRRLAKRFCSDFMMQNDATFNTNATKLLLFVAVGVTNTNMTFSAALSFATAESEEAYRFFFDVLNEQLWDDCPPPRVNLADQGKGLIAALPIKLPDCQLQLCSWHAVQNIRARVNNGKRGYAKERRDEIHDAAWAWMKTSLATIDENREALTSLLQPADQEYFETYWRHKEPLVLWCYTRNYRNLGAESTQRNEGIHPVFQAVLNPQISVENAVKAMIAKLRLIYRKLRAMEERSRIDRPRAAEFNAFSVVIGKVTTYAIEKTNPEWIAVKALVAAATAEGEDLPTRAELLCDCELYIRFALPCCHYLLRACVEGFPIPLYKQTKRQLRRPTKPERSKRQRPSFRSFARRDCITRPSTSDKERS